MPEFLSSRPARVLTGFLILQAAVFYSLVRGEPARIATPLSTFPKEFSSWRLHQEGVVEKEVMDVLRADDAITRLYANPAGGTAASLFIAYFGTQRTGKTPHSPKNCLPGSGWTWTVSDQIQIPIASRATPLEVNRYIVVRGNEKSVVLYWYQTPFRTVAKEYEAKIYTVVDSIRYNRSDTTLVKVVVPMRSDGDDAEATRVGEDFIRSFYDKIGTYFPA